MSAGRHHERRFRGSAEALRSPGRLALLEPGRVVRQALDGLRAASALDVGTGSGIFAEAFAGQGLRVTGIDASAGMLAEAQRLVPSAGLVLGTAEDLPWQTDSFDLVFLGHVLHETGNPRWALAEARRVARLRVLVLEWPYLAGEHGPPLAHRLSPEAIEGLAGAVGYGSPERSELAHMDLYRLDV